VLRCRAQRGAEHQEPPEDQAEADDLESGEGDESQDEDHDRRHECDGDAARGQAQAPRRPRAREHDDEDAEERQHRPRGAALVERRVDIERHEADEGEVGPERGEEDHERAREMRVRVHGVFEAVQDRRELLTHARREDDQQAAGGHRADVERHAREVAVGPELAEVQGPPLRVRGRGGRNRRPEDEQHDRHDRELARIDPRAAEDVDGIEQRR